MLALVTDSKSPAKVRLDEVAAPTATAHDAVVDVRAVSLNRGEVRGLASRDGARPGWDLAGVVARAAADGSGPAVGARVVGYVAAGVDGSHGSWAQQVAVPSHRLGVLPEQVSFAAASTLPIAGLTALHTLRAGGNLLGKRVLVGAASGGVGRFAIELAARAGAEVTALVTRADRKAALAGLGAHAVAVGLDEARGDYDLILESVGGPALAHALGHVAPGGTIVTFGNSSGEPTTFRVNDFFMRSGARLQAYLIFAEPDRHAGRELGYLAGLIAGGALHPRVELETSWRDAGTAIAALLDRKLEGKAVLRID